MINLNQFSWPINVAIGGVVFSIASLIYNESYIYYGLATFVFGVLGQMVVNFFDWFFHIDQEHKYVDQQNYWIAHLTLFILFVSWLFAITVFYLTSN